MTKNRFDILIVANGEIAPANSWQDIIYTSLISTDGAAKRLQEFGITPNIIIGDFDSLNVDAKHFPHSELRRIADQNTTDLEKALQYCMHLPNKKILCLGALGASADHAIHNLSLLARYGDALDLTLLNMTPEGREWIFKLKPNMRIYTTPQSIMSFFPFPEAILSAPTLEWPLHRTHINQRERSAVRNRTTTAITEIRCEGVCLGFVNTQDYPLVA